jgi:diguanylate cyclase (GGDEF)-like protein
MKDFLTSLALPHTARPKLLLVDDQAINIRLLHELFKADCDVYMATDGQQAIEKSKSLLPDLILLDVVMPGMSGHDVCRVLKKDPLTQHIPIVFVTAQFEEADEVLGFQLGAIDFIRKPINPVITLARVYTQLALKRQSDILHSLAMLDGLTGIANRRKFEEALADDWLQCAREQEPLALIMIDVDYFKRYNDFYGHLAGDDCLKQIALVLKGVLQRPYDLAARYGGEEFVLLLPKTNFKGMEFIVSSIESALAALAIEHKNSDVKKVVTLSMGAICTVPKVADRDVYKLVAAADEQLYKAKSNGRNTSCVAMVE